jgi:hypothetical protein
MWIFPDNHRARGEQIVLVLLHKSFVFFGTEFILISLISLLVTSTKRLATADKKLPEVLNDYTGKLEGTQRLHTSAHTAYRVYKRECIKQNLCIS